MVRKDNPNLSVSKLGFNHSSVYGKEKQSTEFEVQVKYAIVQMNTDYLVWGTRRIATTLAKGYLVQGVEVTIEQID